MLPVDSALIVMSPKVFILRLSSPNVKLGLGIRIIPTAEMTSRNTTYGTLNLKQLQKNRPNWLILPFWIISNAYRWSATLHLLIVRQRHARRQPLTLPYSLRVLLDGPLVTCSRRYSHKSQICFRCSLVMVWSFASCIFYSIVYTGTHMHLFFCHRFCRSLK